MHSPYALYDQQGIPCFLFSESGRPLLVGIRPLQLWPLLLCKALLKVMAAYTSLHMSLPHQVSAAGHVLYPRRLTSAEGKTCMPALVL
jgi:hypothetical protein